MKIKFIFLFILSCFSLDAFFESERDEPIDLTMRWGFIKNEIGFFQHQCSPERIKKLSNELVETRKQLAVQLNLQWEDKPFQFRIYSNQRVYTQLLQFSAKRNIHFNPSQRMLVSHCYVSTKMLRKTFIFSLFGDTPLRYALKSLIAELFSHDDPWESAMQLQTENASGKLIQLDEVVPKKLIPVLIKNHEIDSGEMGLVFAWSKYLQKHHKLQAFLRVVVERAYADDTGIDAVFSFWVQNDDVDDDAL